MGQHDVTDFDCILTRAMPASSLQQIVFRMDWLDQLQRQTGILVVNPAKTIEASVDKYLSLELIRSQNVPVPGTRVSQTAAAAIQDFESMDNDTVVKPVFGSGGRGIVRLNDIGEAQIHFEKLVEQQDVIYQQQYIEHGDSDIRLLVIGDNVISMRRTREGQWITNARLGAHCTAHQPTDAEISLARDSARAVGAFLSGVDLVYDSDGNPYVVEINACPAWKALVKANNTDVAAMILSEIERRLGSSAN